jgi:hypothetical protein
VIDLSVTAEAKETVSVVVHFARSVYVMIKVCLNLNGVNELDWETILILIPLSLLSLG